MRSSQPVNLGCYPTEIRHTGGNYEGTWLVYCPCFISNTLQHRLTKTKNHPRSHIQNDYIHMIRKKSLGWVTENHTLSKLIYCDLLQFKGFQVLHSWLPARLCSVMAHSDACPPEYAHASEQATKNKVEKTGDKCENK